MNKIYLPIFFGILFSCSFSLKDKHYYSLPNKLENPEAPIVKLTFALTNSFYGEVEPTIEYYEKNQGIFVNTGGCENLTKFSKALKEYYKDHLILSHLGNITYKNKNKLSSINCLNKVEYDVVAPSAEDFIEKRGESLSKDSPLLISNFIDLKTGKPYAQSPYAESILLEKAGVKIGLISVIDTNKASTQIGKDFIEGIFIEDATTTILKEKNELNKNGAQVIVLLIQSLSQCQADIKNLSETKHNQLDCRFSDPLKEVIKKLPRGTLDLIMSDSKEHMANGYLAEIPVIQNPGKTKFISMAEIYYNTFTKEVLKDKTRVLPSLKICSKYFEATEDCYMKSSKGFHFKKTRNDILGTNPVLVLPKVLGIALEKY